MEVFFNNLVADESATDKLLHDLSAAEEGAEELFAAEGKDFAGPSREKFLTRVEQVKATLRSVQNKTVAGAKAADRAMRDHPYSLAGIAFGLGLVLGALMLRKSADAASADE